MRTFLAIELPPPVQAHLTTVQQQLQTGLQRVRLADCFNWITPEKTHITLRFLGETSAQQVAQIAQELPRILDQQVPFPLTVEGVGAFPNFRRPNILWLGLGGDLAALQLVQQAIEALVQRAGFTPERRAFSPHLTLARARRQAASAALGEAGRTMQNITAKSADARCDRVAAVFTVTQIVHMQSELHPEGARYAPLGYFGLKCGMFN